MISKVQGCVAKKFKWSFMHEGGGEHGEANTFDEAQRELNTKTKGLTGVYMAQIEEGDYVPGGYVPITKPRAYTIEEVKEMFMRHLAELATYAAREQRWVTPLEKCNGLVFCILNVFDGTSMALPSMDISLRPHPSDKKYHQNEGSNWYKPGMVFNDEYLHESWHKYERKS